MLPFTADVLFSDFAQYNRALWPLPALAPALCLAAILLPLRPMPGVDRTIAALLAAAWLWVGIGYHILQFASLNFVAPVYGALFVLEGLLLAWSGVLRNDLAFRFRAEPLGWCGLVLAIAGTLAWPLADGLIWGWRSARLAGLAPGPTALLTLGLLLLNTHRTPVRLAIVPLLWTLVSGLTAWVLGVTQDLLMPVAGIAGFCLILWKNRSCGAS
jgi:Family of unknown function (DUF6064)